MRLFQLRNFKNAMELALFSLVVLVAPGLRAQTITTSAGNTTWGSPTDVVIDASGNQWVVDYSKFKIYKVDRLGAVTVVAGNGTSTPDQDGGLATATGIWYPHSIALAADGSFYFTESGTNSSSRHRIRKVAPNGIITTVAGIGTRGFTGDGGPATQARIDGPTDIVMDAQGNLIFADSGNNRIRMINQAGIISTLAGTGTYGFTGDGGPPLLANIVAGNLAIAPDGSLYFSPGTYTSVQHKIRRISADRTVITTVSGSAVRGEGGDGGPATDARFLSVYGLAFDGSGNLYVADPEASRVRRISASGIINNYAGTGRSGSEGDGGAATSAQLDYPVAVATESGGNLYIADYDAGRIRKVAPAAAPSITHANPAFMGVQGISSNTYLEIFGSNLASGSRTWGQSDFNGANAPTLLDGTRVLVNGKQAFVYYVSPQQVNINTPEDPATGNVDLQVLTPAGTSNTIQVRRAKVSPTLQTVPQFLVGGKQFVVAQAANFSAFIGNPGMLSGVNFRKALVGETVIIYALGLGPTVPATSAGIAAAGNSPLALPYVVKIGGKAARVTFAGLAGGTIGLYQLNVEIPDLPSGDHLIELEVDGVHNEQALVIAVGP